MSRLHERCHVPSSTLIPLKALRLLLLESLLSSVWLALGDAPGMYLKSALESSCIQFESIAASTSENPFHQRIISTFAKDLIADEHHQDPQPLWSYEMDYCFGII